MQISLFETFSMFIMSTYFFNNIYVIFNYKDFLLPFSSPDISDVSVTAHLKQKQHTKQVMTEGIPTAPVVISVLGVRPSEAL